MRQVAFVAAVMVLALAAGTRADRVHLVGGNVVEGKATRQGDKVIVEVESGELTLPADSVVKIESSESAVQRFEARNAKLAPGDVKGMLALADFCRDHEMRDRELQVLRRVIEVDPNHKEARARLGYVHTDAGWITRDEQMRAQGMVQHNGEWVTREQLMQIERAETETVIAAREREQAQLDVERKRVELEKEKSERDAARAQVQQQQAQMQPYPAYQTPTMYGSYPVYSTFSPFPTYGGSFVSSRCVGWRCAHTAAPPPASHSFPIAGVRDPFDYFR